MRRIGCLLLGLLLFQATSLIAQTCESTTWFSKVSIDSAALPPSGQEYVVELHPAKGVDDKFYLEDEKNLTQFDNGAGIVLRATTESNRTVDLTPQTIRISNSIVELRYSPSEIEGIGEKLVRLDAVVPSGRLFCQGALVLTEVLAQVTEATIPSQDEPIAIADWLKAYHGGPRPWITNFELGTAGDDEEGRGVLAVDFDLEKGFSLGDSRIVNNASWRQMEAKLDISGSFSTREEEYFDSLQAKLEAGLVDTDILGTNRFLRSWALVGSAGPEATVDGEDLDYVYGVRAWTILGLKIRTGNRTNFQPFPVFSLAVESIDPDKREDGTVPENYNRATAALKWKIYLSDLAAFDIDGEVRRRLDGDSKDRWSRRWDLSLSVLRESVWQPFLTYSRGEEPPKFEFHEEVLAGIKVTDLFGLLSGDASPAP